MTRVLDISHGNPVTELAIVDTFTKLIFGQEEEYSPSELSIIQAFRLVDTSVAVDSYRDMGQYLRAMGVAEMVQLVPRVHARLTEGVCLVTSKAGQSILSRRAH